MRKSFIRRGKEHLFSEELVFDHFHAINPENGTLGPVRRSIAARLDSETVPPDNQRFPPGNFQDLADVWHEKRNFAGHCLHPETRSRRNCLCCREFILYNRESVAPLAEELRKTFRTSGAR